MVARTKLTLSDLKKRCGHWLGGKKTETVAWAGNLALEEMAYQVGPPVRSTFTTVTPYTTGTVTATLLDATLTGSSTVWTSAAHDGQIVQVSGDDTWFDITSVASNTSLEMSSVWAQATGASKTYEIAFPLVTLDADVLDVMSVGRANKAPLKKVTHERSTHLDFTNLDPKEPVAWSNAPFAPSTGKTRIRLHHPPDDDYVYSYVYRKRPLFFDEDDGHSTSDFPDYYNSAIFAGTMFYLFDQESTQERSAYWRRIFLGRLDALKDKALHNQYVRLGAFRTGRGLVYRQGEIVDG